MCVGCAWCIVVWYIMYVCFVSMNVWETYFLLKWKNTRKLFYPYKQSRCRSQVSTCLLPLLGLVIFSFAQIKAVNLRVKIPTETKTKACQSHFLLSVLIMIFFHCIDFKVFPIFHTYLLRKYVARWIHCVSYTSVNMMDVQANTFYFLIHSFSVLVQVSASSAVF